LFYSCYPARYYPALHKQIPQQRPPPPNLKTIAPGDSGWVPIIEGMADPVKAPILNLSTEKGGLKPVKLGGGKQSKSLRMEDPTGKQYALRLIEKFITAKTLPADLQSQAAEDLVADGVSASYPLLLYQYRYYPRQPVFLIIK
jgi:hypothetical protein